MSRMKNEISSRNPYHISKHKMLELRHFCLQYPEWKKEYSRLSQISIRGINLDKISTAKTNDYIDQTTKIAVEKAEYFNKMKLVEHMANEPRPAPHPVEGEPGGPAVRRNAGGVQLCKAAAVRQGDRSGGTGGVPDPDLHHPAVAAHRRHSARGGRKTACGPGRDGIAADHHHRGCHHAADLLQCCKDRAASVSAEQNVMTPGSCTLPGVMLFLKTGKTSSLHG